MFIGIGFGPIKKERNAFFYGVWFICYNTGMRPVKAHLFIEGRVQGVFYRAFTRNVGVGLGLSGWVRNLYDGRVEAVFEGDRQLIEQAVQECRRGPAGAHVSGIDLTWEEGAGETSGFEIRY